MVDLNDWRLQGQERYLTGERCFANLMLTVKRQQTMTIANFAGKSFLIQLPMR